LKSATTEFLADFLSRNSRRIVEDISRHGALLFRGFDVTSPDLFERSIHSIEGIRGMKDILFIHDGRSIPVGNTQFVFHTSLTKRLEKTGGTLKFGYFHTENYGIPDVPSYVALFCEAPSVLGGETGLVDMASVYAALPKSLQNKLAETACLVKLHAISDLSEKFSASAEAIEDFCARVSLPVVTVNGVKFVAVYKPSLLQHPLTQTVSLSVNFAYMADLQPHVITEFWKDYSGLQWLFHRRTWKSWIRDHREKTSTRGTYEPQQTPRSMNLAGAESPIPGARTLTAVIDDEDRRIIAAAIRRSYFSFLWKKQDFLIVDNLRMAHTGMPGLGHRKLKVMMCNPLHFYTSKESSGFYALSRGSEAQECLGATLAHFVKAEHCDAGQQAMSAI
jgi:hypothetical protein